MTTPWHPSKEAHHRLLCSGGNEIQQAKVTDIFWNYGALPGTRKFLVDKILQYRFNDMARQWGKHFAALRRRKILTRVGVAFYWVDKSKGEINEGHEYAYQISYAEPIDDPGPPKQPLTILRALQLGEKTIRGDSGFDYESGMRLLHRQAAARLRRYMASIYTPNLIWFEVDIPKSMRHEILDKRAKNGHRYDNYDKRNGVWMRKKMF
jgi:hypothetical protein